jgi:hypothetical protein
MAHKGLRRPKTGPARSVSRAPARSCDHVPVRLALTTLTFATALVLTGCSAHIDTRFVSSEQVETRSAAALVEGVGQAPDDVDCPDPLPARVGARGRCTITVDDVRIGMTVSLAEPREGTDDEFTLKVKVDDEPLPGGS